MVDIEVLQSFKTQKDSLDGLLWLDGELWVISAKAQELIGQRQIEEGKLDVFKEISSELENPGDLTWNGSQFLVPEKNRKVIYQIDPKKQQLNEYMDLMKVEDREINILKAENAKMPSIAYNNSKLWLTCRAGYSSSIFCFDAESKELETRFFARGPKPFGISFETNGELGWVLDGSNSELSQFDLNGEWTGETLDTPLKRPFGLTLDDEDQFWTVDRETQKIYQLSKGG